jgi:hypothetical protein
MATKTLPAAPAVAGPQFVAEFTSLKDLGYKQADNSLNTVRMAQFALENIAKFPAEISSEAKEELYTGYRLRFSELKPAKMYAVLNDHIVLATEEHAKMDKIEKLVIGVAFAFSFTSQEFGKMLNTRPELHRIVKDIRDKTATFCSNRLSDLKREANKILNEGKERTRTANKNFDEFVDDWFKNTAPTRMKGAKARGDGASEGRFNRSKVAFMVEWNKG